MKVSTSLTLEIKNKEHILTFGIADQKQEQESVHRLRYQIYLKKEYIDQKDFPDESEKDSFDEDGSCIYFIACVNKKIFGTIRLIKTNPLPTEKFFKFDEPDQIKELKKSGSIAELSRFVIKPTHEEIGEFLPRNLTMLFILDSLMKYSEENNIQGGYFFLKNSLETKMEKLKFPLHPINNYALLYPKNAKLSKYFYQPTDTVAPFYFLTQEYKKYLSKVTDNKLIFEKENSGREFRLKSNPYTHFLRMLGVIK